jgi:hypothetical protein
MGVSLEVRSVDRTIKIMTSIIVNDVSMYDFCALHGIVCISCKQRMREGRKNCLVNTLKEHEKAHPDNHPHPNAMHQRREIVKKYIDFVNKLVSEMVEARASGDTMESVMIQHLGPLQLYRCCSHDQCHRLLIDPKNSHGQRKHGSYCQTFCLGYASRFEIKTTACQNTTKVIFT